MRSTCLEWFCGSKGLGDGGGGNGGVGDRAHDDKTVKEKEEKSAEDGIEGVLEPRKLGDIMAVFRNAGTAAIERIGAGKEVRDEGLDVRDTCVLQ